jgi:[protein-PII] uridylyltransferase
VPQPELLVLGMMFHDVGKGYGHDHSGRGARMMREIAMRLGLNVDERAACEFLVQHHLLMSNLAQRRDIGDDQLVIDFCRTVGSVENLQRLYLLTYADMRAVGPGVWSNWRDSLLAELYVRAREIFEKGVFEAEDRAARAARIRERVAAAAGEGRGRVETFLATMPDGYLLSTPEEVIGEHGELRRRFLEREAAGDVPAVATRCTHFPERGYSEFAVCLRDRPGLFAMLSGVLAANGMNILAARITTSRDDVALDAFRISHAGSDPRDETRWERVERTLGRVLAGELDVEELVRRSERPSILARRRRPVPTTVEVDNRVSREYTVLDVYTGDRVGLLFTITNCLYHLWLEIHLAKITTMVDQVLDVFYVTDHEGRKIEDPERLALIQRELTRSLEAEAPAAEPARVASG